MAKLTWKLISLRSVCSLVEILLLKGSVASTAPSGQRVPSVIKLARSITTQEAAEMWHGDVSS